MILLMLVSMLMLSTVNAASVASAALHIFFVSLAGVMLVMLVSVGTIRLPHTKVCAIWFSAFSYVVFFIECLSSSPHSLSLSFPFILCFPDCSRKGQSGYCENETYC